MPVPPSRPMAAAVLSFALAAPLAAQDAERSAHGDQASTPQVAFEAKGPDWSVRQYQLGCLSLLSYLVVSRGEAAVIDPQRDVDRYLADAAALQAKIRYAILTHPHADFVAGHTELAARAGATILLARAANAAFAHQGLADGDRVPLGALSLEAWATPGHTPNTMTFLLHVPGSPGDPAFAFTGDTLFVGSIGRPDLLDVPPAQLAASAWTSVQRLKTLPDTTVVLPAHGAGSLCGAHLSPETSSTIGAEKANNPYLRIQSRGSFVANLLGHQPVAPNYFRFNVALNLQGPPLVDRGDPLPVATTPAAAKALLAANGWLVDLRDEAAWAAAHVTGAIHIALRGRLDTWTGIVVPPEAPLLLVGSDDEVREGAFRLRRIGYDHVAGRLAGDAASWRAGGLDVRATQLLAPRDLAAAMQRGDEPLVVDVRTPEEFADLRLGDVGNVPVTEAERIGRTFERDQAMVLVCNSAYRSSMAVGLCERLGFANVSSLAGGLDAWLAAGLPTMGRLAPGATAATAPAAPQAPASAPTGRPTPIALPEPIDAPLLLRVLAEQPQAYAVFDLRPAWQFADWHVEGSENVAIDALPARLATVPAATRIVLVDRDGTTAFAVAGALLAQQPQRALRVLLGGALACFRAGAGAPTSSPAAAGAATAAPAGAPATSAPPAAPRKRNAGC